MHFSLNKGDNWNDSSLTAHVLRESFRWEQWRNSQNEVTRDSRCCKKIAQEDLLAKVLKTSKFFVELQLARRL